MTLTADHQFQFEYLADSCDLSGSLRTELLLVVGLLFSHFFLNLTKFYLIRYCNLLTPMTLDFVRTTLMFVFNIIVYDICKDNQPFSTSYFVETVLKVGRGAIGFSGWRS